MVSKSGWVTMWSAGQGGSPCGQQVRVDHHVVSKSGRITRTASASVRACLRTRRRIAQVRVEQSVRAAHRRTRNRSTLRPPTAQGRYRRDSCVAPMQKLGRCFHLPDSKPCRMCPESQASVRRAALGSIDCHRCRRSSRSRCILRGGVSRECAISVVYRSWSARAKQSMASTSSCNFMRVQGTAQPRALPAGAAPILAGMAAHGMP